MSDNRPPRYEEQIDGQTVVIYRASGITKCVTELAAYGLDLPGAAPPPPHVQRGMDEGTAAEDAILAMLNDGTAKVDFAGNQYSVRMDSGLAQLESHVELGDINGRAVVIRAHTDGIATVSMLAANGGTGFSNRRAVVEVKFLGPDYWRKFNDVQGTGFKEDYTWQASIYSHALGLPVLFVGAEKIRKQREDGEDYTEIGQVRCVWIETPAITLGRLIRKVQQVEDVIDSGVLPDCPGVNFPCAYYSLHTGKPDAVEEKREVKSDHTLRLLVIERNAHNNVAKRAEEERKKFDAKIKEWFDKHDGELTYVTDAGGKRYKTERVKATVEAYTVKASTRDYIQVTEVKADPFDGVNGEPEQVKETVERKPVAERKPRSRKVEDDDGPEVMVFG